jgi:hypothetical protein
LNTVSTVLQQWWLWLIKLKSMFGHQQVLSFDIDETSTGGVYLWSNAATSQNLTDVADGIYSLTIDGTTTLPVIVGSQVVWENAIRSTPVKNNSQWNYPWTAEAAAALTKLASGENGGFTFVVEIW